MGRTGPPANFSTQHFGDRMLYTVTHIPFYFYLFLDACLFFCLGLGGLLVLDALPLDPADSSVYSLVTLLQQPLLLRPESLPIETGLRIPTK